MFVTEHNFKLIGLIAVALLFFSTSQASPPSSSQAVGQQETELTPNQQVEQAFTMTEGATTVRDFTRVIDRCYELKLLELSESHAEYVTTLISWAHRRRAQAAFKNYERLLNPVDPNVEPDPDNAALILTSVIADFDVAAKSPDKPANCFRQRGIALVADQRYADALEDFDRSLEAEPGHLATVFNRAEVRLQLDMFQDAIEDYNLVLAETTGDLQALTGRGHAYMGLEDWSAALADYDAVASLQPEHPVARLNRGEAELALGQFDEALADFRKSMETEYTPLACQRVARILATCPLRKLHDTAEALELAKRALESGGETLEILQTVAAAYAHNGDFENAYVVQQQAIDLPHVETTDLSNSILRLTRYENKRRYQVESPAEQTTTVDEGSR